MNSLIFDNVYMNDSYVLISKDEKNKQIKKYDKVLDNYYFGEKTFELAEIKMQKYAILNLINKNKLSEKEISYLVGGDLNNQIAASSYASQYFKIPFVGVYSACATFIESLLVGSSLINNKNKKAICTVSSHSQTAERQFRYPVEYGNNKPETATSTATGAVSILISNNISKVKIISGTFGKSFNLDVKDTNYMGAVMAPACANTLYEHLCNFKLKSTDYDLILTGDLGKVGLDILKEYYDKTFHEKLNNIKDAGSILYENNFSKYSGGSGPCCLPIVLFGSIIPMRKYHKILLLGTGSLHNSALVNQKQSIPAVCHAVSLEVCL